VDPGQATTTLSWQLKTKTNQEASIKPSEALTPLELALAPA